ncbi:MAG: malonic semialdehyde reductase [Alphaproteobacteria bacterium]|nr:MAG: malonic semialdehyde reductase [Alphaproteobacteria bacterium]
MIDSQSLDLILRGARTHNVFQDKPVSDAQLRQIHEIMKWGPTSTNCQPARIVFVRTQEGKDKLRPALSPGNTDKTMAAPITAIIAYDSQFYEHMPRVFPHNPAAQSLYSGEDKKEHALRTAFRNGSLQGAYFIVAVRALGLDAGAMSGFNNALVDQAFFPDGRFKSNFLCNIGYGDHSKLFNQNPRLDFEDVCSFA